MVIANNSVSYTDTDTIVLLVSPESVGSILTGPGPLCEGDAALFTCNVTRGTIITWNYVTNTDNNFFIGETLTPGSQPSYTDTVEGVFFSITVLMPTSTHFVSQLSFTASAEMTGEAILCRSGSPAGVTEKSITLQVDSISK